MLRWLLKPHARFRRSPRVSWRRIDDSVVVLDQVEGELIRFNGVGDRVWEELDGRRSVCELSALICAEFDAKPADVEKDVAAFLRRLADMELVEQA